MRIEASFLPGIPDGRAHRVLRSLADLETVSDLALVDVYLPVGPSIPQVESVLELFHDPVVQHVDVFDGPRSLPEGWDACVEVAYRPGVTDPVAVTIRDALHRGAPDVAESLTDVRTATQYRLRFASAAQTTGAEARSDAPAPKVAGPADPGPTTGPNTGPTAGAQNGSKTAPGRRAVLDEIARRLHNPLIQDARILADARSTLPPQYPGLLQPATGTTPAPGASAAPETTPDNQPPPATPGEQPPPATPGEQPPPARTFPIAGMTDDELLSLSKKRLLALTLEEMKAIQGYFARLDIRSERTRRGVPEDPTDCELEMLAQTWSEHCKHKIFQARVHYREADTLNGGAPHEDSPQTNAPQAVAPQTDGQPETIDGLFKTYIRKTTEDLLPTRDDVLSVFHDNAGVVAFDDDLSLCFKVETHNSPSALDPYGGAITGIVGVNRDILGTGLAAKPFFNTNVLCFGPPDLKEVPKGLLHPRRVLDGVHHGIVDGGNQSGIPTVAGAFLFDQSFVGKPLVFCGTGGLLPRRVGNRDGFVKEILPGDVAVMVGGRIGKDGIHGATFSSLALDEESPVSAVQIGDPITQKRMTDCLLEARDAGLFRALSDNGAGGLSSSLGEMAELSGGVRVFLERCPLKYEGLEPWEIFVSESQERMSVAVQPENLGAFIALARRHGVEATAIGEFTDFGYVEVSYAGSLIGLVSLGFLHDGNPQLELDALWPGLEAARPSVSELREQWQSPEVIHGDLLALLADPNIGSREALIRQYDHEVQGRSATKPFGGAEADAPTDGAVFFPRYDSAQAAAVSHGVSPWIGDYDTGLMARYAVDEAVRALVALGVDPNRISALDNFCWSDPVAAPDNPEGPHKMAQLVRACRGLAEACTAYAVPLISGKDSMKNDAVVEGRRISVRPTLLISALGILARAVEGASTDFKRPGDRIYLLGDTPGPAAEASDPAASILGCSAYERLKLPEASPFERRDSSLGVPPAFEGPQMAAAKARYLLVHQALAEGLLSTIHDLSDGGLAVALAESAIGGRLGARVQIPARHLRSGAEPSRPADSTPDSTPDGGPARSADTTPAETLFCEAPGRFLVSVSPDKAERFEELLDGSGITYLGEVGEEPEMRITFGDGVAPSEVVWGINELVDAWQGTGFGRPSERGVPSSPSSATSGPMKSAPAAEPQDSGPASSRQHEPGLSTSGPAAKPVRVAVLTGYGINADAELAEAFRAAGGSAYLLHLESLFAEPARLSKIGILAFPGGFSYGDHLGSGRALSFLLERRLGPEIRRFVDDGGLVIGICNGFQVLTKLGLLPGPMPESPASASSPSSIAISKPAAAASLIHNDSGVFEDSWVRIAPEAGNSSPWLTELDAIDVPIRHGEGRFYAPKETIRTLEENAQVAFRYLGRNPNGSLRDIAGITDATGRVLGLMPHPEAFLRRENHPLWHSGSAPDTPSQLFANGLTAARG